MDLSGVGSGLPRATPAEVVQVKSRSNSASPRWTWTLPVRPQPGSVRSSSATVRLTLEYLSKIKAVTLEAAMALLLNGSPFGDPGPHGDLFGDLGPLFLFWVPFFSILD